MSPPVSVLIVEDQLIIAANIRIYLEELGYAIAGILHRGEQALDHCRSAPPDILLLDVQLKGEREELMRRVNLVR
ncbi:MAG: response regulator [Lewinella sp.]